MAVLAVCAVTPPLPLTTPESVRMELVTLSKSSVPLSVMLFATAVVPAVAEPLRVPPLMVSVLAASPSERELLNCSVPLFNTTPPEKVLAPLRSTRPVPELRASVAMMRGAPEAVLEAMMPVMVRPLDPAPSKVSEVSPWASTTPAESLSSAPEPRRLTRAAPPVKA